MSSKIKKGNFIVIQSFMVTDLKLKGNELLIYALIYGFSQDGENKFTGSLNYIAEWTNTTKRAVIGVLKKMVDKKLLKKEEKFVNGLKFCSYSAESFTGGEKSSLGCRKVFTGGGEKSSPNNIINNIDNNIERSNNSQPPLVQQMLNKYNSLNFKKYEIVPSSKVFTDANNALGTKKLFEALEIMSRSSWVRENMSIESIFKTDNLKKALNGAYRADKEEIKPVKLKVAKEVDEWEEWKNDRV